MYAIRSYYVFDRGILDHLIYPACIITSKSILEYVNTPFLELFGINSDERKFDWPNLFKGMDFSGRQIGKCQSAVGDGDVIEGKEKRQAGEIEYVITSYSIHYTKLYDLGNKLRQTLQKVLPIEELK